MINAIYKELIYEIYFLQITNRISNLEGNVLKYISPIRKNKNQYIFHSESL